MKKGIYETIYGNAAYVRGPKAKTAWDLDMGEKIPMSVVTTKFLRAAEPSDTPTYQKYNW
jgi:hypothetical protein